MVFLQYLSLPGVVRLTVCRYELLQEEERERDRTQPPIEKGAGLFLNYAKTDLKKFNISRMLGNHWQQSGWGAPGAIMEGLVSLEGCEPELRDYLERHDLPGIMEALLTGLTVMTPRDPWLFVSQSLSQIREGTITDIARSLPAPPLPALSNIYLSLSL